MKFNEWMSRHYEEMPLPSFEPPKPSPEASLPSSPDAAELTKGLETDISKSNNNVNSQNDAIDAAAPSLKEAQAAVIESQAMLSSENGVVTESPHALINGKVEGKEREKEGEKKVEEEGNEFILSLDKLQIITEPPRVDFPLPQSSTSQIDSNFPPSPSPLLSPLPSRSIEILSKKEASVSPRLSKTPTENVIIDNYVADLPSPSSSTLKPKPLLTQKMKYELTMSSTPMLGKTPKASSLDSIASVASSSSAAHRGLSVSSPSFRSPPPLRRRKTIIFSHANGEDLSRVDTIINHLSSDLKIDIIGNLPRPPSTH